MSDAIKLRNDKDNGTRVTKKVNLLGLLFRLLPIRVSDDSSSSYFARQYGRCHNS